MVSRRHLLVFAAWWTLAGPAAAEIAARIRLNVPLRSDSVRRGSTFSATLVTPLAEGERVLTPAGTVIHGTVDRVRAVGRGLVRERAWLELAFREYELADGRRMPMHGRLLGIDNAKEEVTSQGRIRGVVAASHAYGYLHGLWFQPSVGLLPRSAAGLMGASGKVWSRFSLGPIGAASLLVLRLAVLRLPEPEIALPAGTELHISMFDPPEGDWLPASPPDTEAAAIGAGLSEYPFAVAKPNGKPADDFINLAFAGTREEVQDAFRSAGWMPADAMTRQSFVRAYHAYTTMSGYPTAPVSELLYEGEPPSLVFQKSFNTMTKRHHVRIWPAPWFGNGGVWLGAATHDVAATFERRTISLSHRIDPMVDRERQTIVDDLALAGCTAPAAYVDRPAAVSRPGMTVVTDGRLAVLRLLPCISDAPPIIDAPPVRSKLARIGRRLTLETRHYLLRGNVYYWVVREIRRQRDRGETAP